jgi:glycine/D-amino acid oxidase-like deaminating enzyme
MVIRNGEVSFWQASFPSPRQLRDALVGSVEADVCIVGAGFTGLWTAYYLKQAQPSLHVVVVEKEFAGFGASGRNGGWLSDHIPGFRGRYAAFGGGRASVEAWQRQLQQTVDDVIRVCAEEGIDADVVKGGNLQVATSPAQVERLDAALAEGRSWGLGDDDLIALDSAEVAQRITIAGALGGLYTPHCARVHPAKLVNGLADVVERRGTDIYEQSPVLSIEPHRVHTDGGDVRAQWVVRATEGFTAALPGLRRAWLPMNSSMIVTEPLTEDMWQHIGWDNRETLSDIAHAYVYLQRTADDRIAIGGRGVPYRFGSGIDDHGATNGRTIGLLTDSLHRLFPLTRQVGVAHAWCGVLAVARDWCASVGADRESGLAWAGGYVGNGVAMAALGGQTLAELILGHDSSRTQLPWVGHRSPMWEPEPLRWAGVHGLYALYRTADRLESTGGARGTNRAAVARATLARAAAQVADAISGRR